MADIYFDDKQNPIATTTAELIIYFKSFPGTTAVQNAPYILSCPMPALITMQSSNPNLPKFIYKNGLAPSNRIYLKSLSSVTGNLDNLCNGVNQNNLIPRPVLGTVFAQTYIVPIPVIGSIAFTSANAYTLAIVGQNGWATSADTIGSVDTKGVVSMSVIVTHASYGAMYFSNELIATISSHGYPANDVTIYATDNPNLPAGSILQINKHGAIYYTGMSVDAGGNGEISFFNVQYNLNG